MRFFEKICQILHGFFIKVYFGNLPEFCSSGLEKFKHLDTYHDGNIDNPTQMEEREPLYSLGSLLWVSQSPQDPGAWQSLH